MGQLSFYSAEARAPAAADLAGLLCGPGQAVGFGRGTAARVSVVLPELWRARAVAKACAERGVETQLSRAENSPEGHPMVRTAFRADLTALAMAWLRGAVKSVPQAFELDGPKLRIWAMAAGQLEPGGYVLGLDPHAQDTYEPLTAALVRAGLPATLLGLRGGGPALRVTGRRRLARLAELVGPIPAGAAEWAWPAA